MTLDSNRFRTRSFEVSWPNWLIKAELDRLISTKTNDPSWGDQCEFFIAEAFSSSDVLDEWKAVAEREDSNDPWSIDPASPNRIDWLRQLHDATETLPARQDRIPYWSQRRNGDSTTRGGLDLPGTVRRFAALVRDLEKTGYLTWAFGQECVDGDTDGTLGPDAAEEVHLALGRDNLWPVQQNLTNYGLDDLCDVIEFLADHVRRPVAREWHRWNECGWHYNSFDARLGFQLYRWRVNELLSQSVLGLTLTEVGRLETVAPGAVEDLVTAVRVAENVHDADDSELEHALTQFRARNATEMDRRQAVIALAGVLERRRGLVKEQLLSKDEGALFTIANQFGIRHQDAKQQKDYDAELYLEWVFYWYVATINLTNRIVAAQS
ncbi:hypothetical protein AB0K43_31440 [Kitasatospora sp. NPDC049258]|uniref:hypothetical protein n=1 Tax=Kitasatospora sp. NPDC049258 TaxID=3155394 RepID=UPI00343403C6